MKLRFDRSTILGLLAVLFLISYGTQLLDSLIRTNPNFNSSDRSKSSGTARFLFMRNGKFGYIDRTGKIVIPAQYAKAWDFSEGLAAVSMNGETYGCIDTNGKMTILPQKFKFIYAFKDGLAQVTMDGSKGEYEATIDRTGKILSNSTLTTISPDIKPEFGNGLSPTLVEDRLGYEDKIDFSEGLAGVGTGERYGYIDTTGKFVIPPHVGYLYKFKNGLANVIVGDKTRTINRTGTVVTTPVAATQTDRTTGK